MFYIPNLHRVFSVALAVAVIFAFGYHELHYIFTHHQPTEHCENHLHGAEEAHCDFCKLDVTLIAEAQHVALLCKYIRFSAYPYIPLSTALTAYHGYLTSLRGPPSLIA